MVHVLAKGVLKSLTGEVSAAERTQEPGADKAGPAQAFGWRDAVFFLSASAFIYLQLFEFPATPIYFEGDHMLPVSNAIRLWGGEVMYRDFFHFAPPGADLYYETLFSVFGIRIWILNFTILLLGVSQIWLIWFFSRSVLPGLSAYLPAVIFLVFGFRQFGIDGSYRLFSVIFVLLAVAVLFGKRSYRNLLIAGALCGLASFFVQTRGVVGIAGISVFLLWENWRDGFDLRQLLKSGLYVGSAFVATIAFTQFYFAWQGGFDNYYFSLVTFLRKYYASDPLSNSSAYLGALPRLGKYFELYAPLTALSRYARDLFPALFIYGLIPWVYGALLLVLWRRRSLLSTRLVDERLIFLCIVGLAMALGVSAPSSNRFYQVSIPALVIFVWLLNRWRFTSGLALPGLALLSILGISYAVQRQVIGKDYLDMPAGRAAFLAEPTFEKYKWIGEHTSSGDVFYEAFHPSFYFPFYLKNPTPIYLVRDSEYTPRFQVDSIVTSLEKQPPQYVVWEGQYTKPPDARLPGDNLEPLWQFISTNYERVKEFQEPGFTLNSDRDIEVWKRRAN